MDGFVPIAVDAHPVKGIAQPVEVFTEYSQKEKHMDTFNALNARQYISNLQSKPKLQDVPTPYWPDLDGHVAMRKLKADEGLDLANSLANSKQFMAAVLSKSLVLKDTGEQLFDEKGLSLILQEDLDEVKALFKLCAEYNGLGDDTKKNLSQTAPVDSSSDSPGSTNGQ